MPNDSESMMSMSEENQSAQVTEKRKRKGEGGNPVIASDSPRTKAKLTKLEHIFLVELLADDPSRVIAALKSLSLTIVRSSNEEAAQKIATAHGLGAEAIITGNMLKWSSEARIQELGCLGLSNIFGGVGWEEGEDHNPNENGEHGRAIDAIVGAMEDFPDNCNVQRWACGAFYNLACENKVGADYIAEHKDGLALQLIVKAMELFANRPDLQQEAVQALAKLVEHEEVLQVVLQPPLIHAAMEALSNIPVNHPAAKDREGIMELRESTRTLLGILVEALWKFRKD